MRTRENCLEQPPLAEHLETIRALCREFGVKRLEVFGSVCTDDFDPSQSDIDFLVEYPKGYDFGPWGQRLFDLEERLAGVLGRPVDLVMVGAPKNPYFIRSMNQSRQLLYAA